MTESEFREPTPSEDLDSMRAAFAELTQSNELALLERTVQDPYIEKAHAMALSYNEILAYQGKVSMDEAASIESDLDTYWRALLEERLKVTGAVFVPQDAETDDEADDGPRHLVDGVAMLSRGFSVMGVVTGGEEEGYFIENPRIRHAFRVGRGALDATLTGKMAKKKVFAYADVDEVHIETDGVSSERAAAWLESTYPHFFEEINTRVFNSSGDEGGALLSLKGLEFVERSVGEDGSEKVENLPIDDDFTRDCIQTYIQDVIDLDNLIHYSVGMNGPFKIKYGNGADDAAKLDAITDQGMLAYAYGPYIDCEIGENAPDRWSIITEFAVAPPQKNEQPIVIRASVDSVKSMMSIRAAYYGK